MGLWIGYICALQTRNYLAIKQHNSHSLKAKLPRFPYQEKHRNNGVSDKVKWWVEWLKREFEDMVII
jgi:hypothetical protein